MWFSADARSVTGGSLINGSLISDPYPAKIRKIGEEDCIKAIRLASVDKSGDAYDYELLRLPVLVVPSPNASGSLLVRSSKTLVFNRIAKTGSQAMTELLVQLGQMKKEAGSNEMRVEVVLSSVEELRQEPDEVRLLL